MSTSLSRGIVFCISTLMLLFFGAGLATSSTPTPQVLIEQVYETPEFLPLIDIEQAKITLQDLATSIQQMQADYSQVQEKKTYLETRFADMASSIERTIHATQTNKRLVSDTLTKITLLESTITNLKKELILLKQDLHLAREQTTSYILFLYASYQGLYGTTESVSIWKQFLGGRKTEIGITAQQFAQMLTESLQQQLARIQQKQVLYAQKTRDLHTAKIGYYQTAKTLQKDLVRLDQQKQYLYAQLRALQTDKITIDAQAATLQRHQEDLVSQVKKVSTMSFASAGTTSAQVAALLALPDRPVGKNYFTWPVLPPKFISTYFGEMPKEAVGQDGSGSFAQYVRIDMPQGEYIYASAPGLVYAVIQGGFTGASQIILLHKQGLITVYTPLEDIFVAPGAIVRRGQVIATVGGQPGTKGAGLSSSFPHLDYAVYLNSFPKNPFDYLDLSVLAKNLVPEEWRQKQRDDLYSREVPLHDMPVTKGDTVAERRDNFLRRYAGGIYADAGLWYDASEGQGVDPILGICVGFAETSFKHFKTPHNIGNVGNNDRGDEVEYVSPIEGVEALYRVLNNKYLGGYYTLNELSRFGNSDGFIYASSPYNRQRNVMRCLTTIYGYPIPEDFPFRRPK